MMFIKKIAVTITKNKKKHVIKEIRYRSGFVSPSEGLGDTNTHIQGLGVQTNVSKVWEVQTHISKALGI